MPLLEIKATKKVTALCSLEESTALMVDQYAAFTDASADDVVNRAIEWVFDWLNYRHTINRETIAKKYPLNYYFLSSQLASQLINEDNNNHLTTQVMAGQMEQGDVQVNNVTITSMSQERIANAIVSRGTALVTFDKIYSARNSHQPRVEHWITSITYYINPAQVSDHAKTNPQYETINPLGVTITEFHENRVSVDQTPDGTTYNAEAKP